MCSLDRATVAAADVIASPLARFSLFSTLVVRPPSRSPVSSVRLRTRYAHCPSRYVHLAQFGSRPAKLGIRQWLEEQGHEFIVSGRSSRMVLVGPGADAHFPGHRRQGGPRVCLPEEHRRRALSTLSLNVLVGANSYMDRPRFSSPRPSTPVTLHENLLRRWIDCLMFMVVSSDSYSNYRPRT